MEYPKNVKNEAKVALDSIVAEIARIDTRLSGDDSPLTNPWEEIKEQLQNGESIYWQAYLDTIRQIISRFIAQLEPRQLADLGVALGRTSASEIDRELQRRLILRGRKEKIRYEPFDFSCFLTAFTISQPTLR